MAARAVDTKIVGLRSMNGIQPYRDVVDLFVRACASLGDRVVSVIMFGSLVRGDVTPGSSDVLDAIVILRDAVLADPVEYRRVITVFVDTCREIRASGLPFHPFLYYSESEFPRHFEKLFHPLLHSDKLSRVLAGKDIRVRAAEKIADREWDKLVFFGLRRTMQRALPLCQRSDATVVQNTVEWFLKTILTATAIACGAPASYPESIAVVRRLFPELVEQPLERLLRFHNEVSVTDAAAKNAVYDALKLTEDLNTALRSHLVAAGEWSGEMEQFDFMHGPA